MKDDLQKFIQKRNYNFFLNAQPFIFNLLLLFINFIKDFLMSQIKIKESLEEILLAKAQIQKIQLANLASQSYIETQYATSLTNQMEVVDLLNQITKLNPKFNAFNQIAAKLNKYSSSILKYTPQISEVLGIKLQHLQLNEVNPVQNPYAVITQRSTSSQSLLLACLFRALQIENNFKITIITDQSSITTKWQNLVLPQKIVDPESAIKTLLEELNIVVIDLNSFKIQQLINTANSEDIIIFDLFNLRLFQYLPLLLRISSIVGLNKLSKRIIYCHENDQQLILQTISDHSKNQIEPISLSCDYIHPVQVIQFETSNQIENQLVNFIEQQCNHPIKNDIIIFYASEKFENVKSYLAYFNKILQQKKLSENVRFITEKNETNLLNADHKSKIFVVNSTRDLYGWGYNYQNVFMVLSYGCQNLFYYDYQLNSWISSFSIANNKEIAQRMSFVGNYKMGKYLCLRDEYGSQEEQINYFVKIEKDICQFVYEVCKHPQGLLYLENCPHKWIKKCFSKLVQSDVIQKKEDGEGYVASKSIYDETYKHVNPIYLSEFFKIDGKQKSLQNLWLVSLIIMQNEEQLREFKVNKVQKKVNKITGFWGQCGYLSAALTIICEYQKIIIDQQQLVTMQETEAKKSLMKRKTSFVQDPFEHMQNIFGDEEQAKYNKQTNPTKLLMAKNQIDESAFNKIVDKIQDLRELLEISREKCKIDSEKMMSLLEMLIKVKDGTVAHYSGSHRIGYQINGINEGVHYSKQSITSMLNQMPLFSVVLRLKKKEKYEILISETISKQQYIGIKGQLPHMKVKSSNQVELQFHGISTALFTGLYNKYSQQLKRFESENNCLIEPNNQMALIVIHCSKQQQKQIHEKFNALINKFKQENFSGTEIIHYVGNTNLTVGSGGIVTELIKNKPINKCVLSNLDQSCTKQDLHEIFDQFFVLKNIQMILSPDVKSIHEVILETNHQTKLSALIEFTTQRDYYRFAHYYNGCMFMEREMKIKPIQSDIETVVEEKYLRFKWSAWKSQGKAMIQFTTEDCIKNAYQSLEKNPHISGKKVKFFQEGKRLVLQDLNPITDETTLKNIFGFVGKIDKIELLKTPVKDKHEEQLIEYNIKKQFKKQNIPGYKIHPIKKKKNGIRSVKVCFTQARPMQVVNNNLKDKIDVIGFSALNISQRYKIPCLIPKGFQQLYKTISDQVVKQFGTNIRNKIIQTSQGKTYIIFKSSNENILNNCVGAFNRFIAGIPIKLTKQQLQLVMNEFGMSNISDIEQEFLCRFIPDFVNKSLKIVCLKGQFKTIQSEIRKKLVNQFMFKLTINTRTKKYLASNPDKYQFMRKEYELVSLQFDQTNNCFVIEGSATNIQKALTYMMHLSQSLVKPQEEMINSDTCLICYQNPNKPYRLQNCGHRFCFGCLINYIDTVLGDVNMFPLRCPHCMKQIVIGDIQGLFDPRRWQRMLPLIVDKYVAKYSQQLTFCYTAGCKQVSILSFDQFFKCDLCNVSYCLKCKEPFHPGLTCEQAKLGTDVLFKKFMESNGVRKCPNTACQMPIQRSDGCYRVTCTRCNKSMCFKCEPNKMIPYNTSTECYNHLSQVHGGYF